MTGELQQSVLDVTGKNGGVISVFLATVLTGTANVFEVIQPIVGGITSITVFCMACIIFRKKDKLFEKELELKEKQIAAIDERNSERGN